MVRLEPNSNKMKAGMHAPQPFRSATRGAAAVATDRAPLALRGGIWHIRSEARHIREQTQPA